MRNYFVCAIALGLLSVSVEGAQAADSASPQNGQISSTELDQFGLGGMQVVSDEEGQEIRGKGFGGIFWAIHSQIVYAARQNLSPSQVYLLGKIGHKLTGYNRRSY